MTQAAALAPQPRLAHPTPDHLYPVFFAAGCRSADDHVETIVDEFQYETLSMYSFVLVSRAQRDPSELSVGP